MTDLTTAILSGSATALSAAKSLISTPAIIYNKASSANWLLNELAATVPAYAGNANSFFIPLETEQHTQHGDAEVSENLIFSTTDDAKKYIADNVAPGPWTWNLSGYIPGASGLEFTNLYTPFLRRNVNFLKTAFKKGLRLTFKDVDCKLYDNVVIQSIDIDTRPDCRNKCPFTMTLKEINTMSSATANLDTAAVVGTPAEGSSYANPPDYGATSNKDITETSFKAMLNKTGITTLGDGIIQK